jgi:hypothetical protein
MTQELTMPEIFQFIRFPPCKLKHINGQTMDHSRIGCSYLDHALRKVSQLSDMNTKALVANALMMCDKP